MILTKLGRYNCFDPFGSSIRRSSNLSNNRSSTHISSKSEKDRFYNLSSSSPTASSFNVITPQLAQTIPSEILIEICRYLHPVDLYSLASVCKRYRNLLWSKCSTTTQEIWKNSRLKYVPNLSMTPPVEMSEQEYIWLMLILKKCMFCEERNKFELTMYWEFRIYCCQKCLDDRTVSRHTLLNEWNVHDILLSCFIQLQRSSNPRDPPLYLIEDVKTTLNNYNQLSEDEKPHWIINREKMISKLQLENEQYNHIHDLTRYDHTERLERLLKKLHEFYTWPKHRSM